ncbi:radical SAM protein [Patescibacteria group bacterium]|nr:radical SAM protein [Patescibacteria group bacterium]
MYRLSRWCKFFEKGNVVAVFHSLTFDLLFLDGDVGGKLKDLSNSVLSELSFCEIIGDDIFDLLKDNSLIVSDVENDLDKLFSLRNEMKKEVKLNMLYLLLTDGCNLKCRYCFEDTPETSGVFIPKKMSLDCVKQSIDYFARLLKKHGSAGGQKIIHLYGGEPMLNPEAVKIAISHSQKLKSKGQLPKDCEVAIVTNGTLVDDEFAKLFAENGVTVGLSLDGPRRINNAYRIPQNGTTDVFAKVEGCYNLLKKHGVKIGFSSTLSPEVVDNFEEVLNFFVNEIGIQDGICFNILHYNPRINVGERYFQETAKSLIRAFKLFREKSIYEERMMRKAKAFAFKKPIFCDCGVNGGQIVIAPDGKVGVCQDFVKPRKYFGDELTQNPDYDPFESGLYDGWKNRSPFFMEQCYDCEAIALCGGGCPASIELRTGSRWDIDDRVCPHSKQSLEWLIWDTYDNINT